MDIVIIGDLIVNKAAGDHAYYRGSNSDRIETGCYLTTDPAMALWYARNHSGAGTCRVTGHTLTGEIFDATVAADLYSATGVEPVQDYTAAWEILEYVPEVCDSLRAQGYVGVRFLDVEPVVGLPAIKLLGPAMDGVTVATVVDDALIAEVVPAESARIFGSATAIPATEKGWAALGDAHEAIGYDLDLDSAEDYVEYAGEMHIPSWTDVESVL
jgi:hypothetical protein